VYHSEGRHNTIALSAGAMVVWPDENGEEAGVQSLARSKCCSNRLSSISSEGKEHTPCMPHPLCNLQCSSPWPLRSSFRWLAASRDLMAAGGLGHLRDKASGSKHCVS